MTKVINIIDLKILSMDIMPIEQCIRVRYQIYDETGLAYGPEKVETYWVTMPTGNMVGSSDVQLPANYVTLVSSLYTAALGALKAKYI